MSKLLLPQDPTLAKAYFNSTTKQKELDLKAGVLGKFFGCNENTSLYIVGFIAIILSMSGLVYTFLPDNLKTLPTVKYWEIVSPIITTMVGFIFGSKVKSN